MIRVSTSWGGGVFDSNDYDWRLVALSSGPTKVRGIEKLIGLLAVRRKLIYTAFVLHWMQ